MPSEFDYDLSYAYATDKPHQAVKIGNYHLPIRITPENQEQYEKNEGFEKDENEKLYFTLGAESIGGKLVSDKSNPKDLDRPKAETVIVDLERRDEVIAALLEVEDNYQNDEGYDLFPKESDSSGYNSKFYVSGILEFVGEGVPDNHPDIQPPFPKEKFESDFKTPPRNEKI